MVLKRSQAELVANLKAKEGYHFHEFELVHEGNYEVSDADWNYKDVPHLTHVHKLVEGYPSYISSDFIGAIIVQQVLGLKFPAVLFNYQSGPNRQTYHLTMLIYLLIVETSYESLGKNRTRVRTRYAIGCKNWLASLLFPLAQFAIKRNYIDLMSGDIPMRERRGKLRDWGYSFKGDGKPYSFFDTSKIMETNVVPPTGNGGVKSHTIRPEELDETPKLLGESDEFGLSALRLGDKLSFFPRLCPHEGSDLSHTCDGKHAVCPWHGRKFPPAFSVNLSELAEGAERKAGERYSIQKRNGALEIMVAPMSRGSLDISQNQL